MFLAFQRLLVDELNLIVPMAKAKVATQNLNSSSTTFQNDSDLTFSVDANAVYQLEHYYLYFVNASAGLKQQYSGPSGTAVTGGTFDYNPGTRAWSTTGSMGLVVAMTGIAGTVPVMIRALVEVGGTAGTFVAQYAQNAAHASTPQILEGSWMRLTRVA